MSLYGNRGNEPTGNDPLKIRDGKYTSNLSAIADIVILIIVIIAAIFFR